MNSFFHRRKILELLSVLGMTPHTASAQWLNSILGFDRDTVDVIVVGSGGAGLAAAVEAADLKASVLVLEKQAEIGGNTLISGGFYAAVDPIRQKKQGITDSEDLFFQQTYQYGEYRGRPSLIRHLVQEATSTLEWLEKLGMHFQPAVFELYGSHWPRSHIPVLPLGQGYIRTLSAAALQRKVNILTNRKVIDLIVDAGRVTGVITELQGKTKKFTARKGVVLAAGSFAANPELIKKFAPQLSGLTTNNTEASTGEVLMAAHKHGATLVDMEFVQCLPGCLPGKKFRVRFHNDVSRFILINHDGHRFVAEDSPRNVLRDAILSLPQKYGFNIIDNEGFQRSGIIIQKEAVKALEGGEAWKADSLRELALKIGVPADNLEKTVQEYNEGIYKGKDALGKRIHSLTLTLTKPPYWACYAGMTIHYTEGGLLINEKAQCLDKNEKPIPGLYAAGTITGGVHGKNRLGANGLTDAIVFGRTAGRNVAKE